MKKLILSVTFLLIITSALKAQMTKEQKDYIDCVNACPNDNSQIRQQCVEGCRCPKCPTATRVVLSQATDLSVSIINGKSTKDGKVLIYTGKSFLYFAYFRKGGLAGYLIRNKKGMEAPYPIVAFTVNKEKKYFIFNEKSEFLKVIKPAGKTFQIKGTAI